jgi:acyl carrier protein
MTRSELHEKVVSALTTVAPEVIASTLDPHRPLRDQVDIDSMDFLRFLIEVHRATGVDIPESDYGQLGTLDRIVDYLSVASSRLPVDRQTDNRQPTAEN